MLYNVYIQILNIKNWTKYLKKQTASHFPYKTAIFYTYLQRELEN